MSTYNCKKYGYLTGQKLLIVCRIVYSCLKEYIIFTWMAAVTCKSLDIILHVIHSCGSIRNKISKYAYSKIHVFNLV